LGGPKARLGSWQLAHANFPDADKEASKKSARPMAVISETDGGFAKLPA
jgi:hypothetical protein